MIDTHCHLYLEEFDSQIHEIIDRALTNNVTRFYLPAIDSGYSERVLNLQNRYPELCFPMAGLHPCSVNEGYVKELNHVRSLTDQNKYVAIGEIGLDFHWDITFRDQQYKAFREQIELALDNELPIVIHSRKATRECIDVVDEYKGSGLKGIFHCFGGTPEEANDIIGANFFLGIGGVLTYKNSGLDKVVKEIPLEHLVLETDAPYLTPVPFRGKLNEPGYLLYVAEALAKIKSVSREEVERITTMNANKIFNY